MTKFFVRPPHGGLERRIDLHIFMYDFQRKLQYRRRGAHGSSGKDNRPMRAATRLCTCKAVGGSPPARQLLRFSVHKPIFQCKRPARKILAGLQTTWLPGCTGTRTRPGRVEPEVSFRIVQVAQGGHYGAPVAAYREQAVEITLGPASQFTAVDARQRPFRASAPSEKPRGW